MSSRRERREVRDDLDRLLSQAIRDSVRYAEPPPRVWHNVLAAIAEAPPEATPARRADRRPSLWAMLAGLLARLPASGGERAVPVMIHNVGFADISYGSSSMAWWVDAYTDERRDHRMSWQACAMAS